MRKFTKVLCLCLMLALVFSLGLPTAFAEGTEPEPEAVEPTSTPAPVVPDPETPSPYVEPRFPCLHLSKEYVVDEASTCSKEGSGHWVCKTCGATETYSIPKNPFAHNPSATNIVSGSFVDASHTVQCSDCGLKWTELHSRVIDSEKPATCLEDGHSAGVYCSAGCGYDTRIVYSAPGYHSWGEWTVQTPATCTEDGLEVRTCTKCPATEQRTIEAAHKWGEWTVTDATCTKDGEKTRTCSVCKEVETETILSEGHKREPIPGKAATCTEDGLTEGTKCSVCQEILVPQEKISASHNWGPWQVQTPATCTEDGLETRACSKCTATEEQAIKAPGYHNWGPWTETKAATCTEDGLEVRTCSRCQATEERTIKAAHEWGPWADAKDGWRHVRFCVNDPTHKQYDFHKMGDWVTVKYNTETTDGYRERWCQAEDCDYHEIQVIKAGSPQTGDSSNILLYSGLCLISVCGVAGLAVFAKRRKEQ